MSAWKTMESAPKTGQPILAWVPDEDYAEFKGYSVVWFDNGKWLREADDFNVIADPTHWCELPAPPQSSESNARIVAGPEKVE